MAKLLLICCFPVFVVLSIEDKSDLRNVQIENVLRIERLWQQRLKKTVEDNREKLFIIESKQEQISRELPQKDNRSKYLYNLSNAFALARRIAKTWPVLRSAMTTSFGSIIRTPVMSYNSTNMAYNVWYSKVQVVNVTEVWRSAITVLVRLQQVYNISTVKLANGAIGDAHPPTQLSGGDCFDIGVFYYRLRQPWRAVEWLQEALRRVQDDHSMSKADIMEYLHLAHCFKGDSKNSVDTLLALIKEFPLFIPSVDLKDDYRRTTNMPCKDLGKKTKYTLETMTLNPLVHNVKYLKNMCLKENYRPIRDSKLKCRLLDNRQPHLRIAPFKMEELHLDPPLLMIHEVLFDSEIELLKHIYFNRTRHAILDYGEDYDYYQDTQQNTWMWDDFVDNKLGYKIATRSARIANASLYRSEPNMISNYNMGGEIKPHRDIGEDSKIFNPRYSRADFMTFLVYMNEVPEGGYTIFPELKITISPIKGSGLLWFNRNPDWSVNFNLTHAGCPVLKGQKWILTKWFHVLQQEYPKCVPGREKSYKYYYL